MSRQVFGEVVGSGKCFAASVATVRSFTRVNPQVTIHVTFATERSAAKFALERPFTCVFTNVQFQVLLGPEALTAKRTQMRTTWIVFRWRSCSRSTSQTGSRRRIGNRRPTGRSRSGYCSRRSRRRRCRTEIADQIVQERSSSGCSRRRSSRRRRRRVGSSRPSGGRRRAFVADVFSVVGTFTVRGAFFRLAGCWLVTGSICR